MVGEVKKNAKGEPFYGEWLYDRAKGNKLVMQMGARCAWSTAEALPQPTPSGPLATQRIAPAPPQPTAPAVAPPSIKQEDVFSCVGKPVSFSEMLGC
jgi:hypothetical protein